MVKKTNYIPATVRLNEYYDEATFVRNRNEEAKMRRTPAR